MDRAELADFLRTRREALQPEDVGLPRTRRRRTGGLRREEVADLSNMSTDYYTRIEQRRGPRPSEQLLSAMARALRLSPDERDHLFRLAGYPVPRRVPRTDHINPGILAVFRRMEDTPAQIFSRLGETLAQNRLSTLLFGDQTRHTGPHRALAYRWFTDPAERSLLPPEDHARHSRTVTAQLLATHTRDPADPRTAALVGELLRTSQEFAAIWSEHPVIGPYCDPKHIDHPRIGALELHGQTLLDPDESQILTVFTAPPGTESDEKLKFLSVLDDQLV
ncbi:DNA-binding protein [Streptomyces camponoticapitis]|uniref:DNA-binding protein n=1 Tax=Streptomyces camponoticapitis TaxID=1616125 RepID=A0ABQ2E353_9ACTN|nr:helix-turn-helix transcriptional regulator [Streptomyces camponoticapitis]GGJ91700.1 DNA-binding protein [Streptomyces camponoticapitis]